MKTKTIDDELEDYEFLEEEGIGGGHEVEDEGEDHCCYNYGDFSEVEYVDDIASFFRTCSVCETVTRMIFIRKK